LVPTGTVRVYGLNSLPGIQTSLGPGTRVGAGVGVIGAGAVVFGAGAGVIGAGAVVFGAGVGVIAAGVVSVVFGAGA
tara:strand:- start:4017 stop:4247 length:231 start_codon:yes stop_codon:yes gene_type:complete